MLNLIQYRQDGTGQTPEPGFKTILRRSNDG